MRENNRLNDPGQPGSGAVAAAAIAGNEARIRELQEYLGAQGDREKLLAEELEYSEYFRFEDLRQNEDFAQRSRYDASVTDWDYDWVNNPDSAKNLGRAESDRYNIIPHMHADEIAMYNYLYSAQGEKAAKEYLRYLEPVVNQRRAEEDEGLQRDFARKHPVTASGISVLLSPVSGVASTMGGIAEKATGREIDPNSGWYSATNAKNTYRDEVGSVVEENWGPVGSVGYGIGMSILDVLADKWAGIGLAGGGPGSGMAIKGLMGSRAVAETVIDGKNRGLSDDQAIQLGLVSGAAELITEGIGLDEMLKLPKGMEDAGFWRGALKGAVGEAGEEGLTNLINLAADLSIAGEKSEFARSIEYYKSKDMDDVQALEKALADAGLSLALDALGGAVSGGVFGGVDGWRSKRATKAQQKKESTAKQRDGRSAVPYGEDSGGQQTPQPQSAGEPMEAAPAAGVTGENSAAETVPAQTVRENVQKKAAAPDSGTVREDRMVGETVNENGGKANEEAGERLLPGGPERTDAAGAGEQTGSYAEIRERQQAEARSQAEAAAQRRVKAENLEKQGHLQRKSAQDFGLSQGTEVQELLELPRIEWDQELYDTATRLEKETGMKVHCVTGNIGVRLKGGGVGLAKGYIDRGNKTIVLNVCHSQVTAGQIADHELWHHKMEAVGRISGDRYEVTRMAAQRIQEQYSPEDFDEVLDAYIDGYGDVYDQSNWEEFLNRVYEEIMADAYAGMNAFGVEASKFRSTVDDTMDELGMGRNMWNAAEQEDTSAPGGDQRVYDDEDAPPMPEYEDYSQVPQEEYDWDGWDDSMIDFSFDGEAAHKKQLGFNKNTLEDGIEKTAKMAPVYDLRGNEFKTGKDMVSAVHSYFESFGGKVENEQLGEVILSKRGIKDDLAHGMGAEKAASFAAVPEVLRSGKVVDYQKNWKGRGYDTATIAAPIRIAGTEYMMGVVLKRSNQMNRFYIHEVATKKEGTSPFMTGAQEMGLPGGEVPSINSILQRIWDVKNGDARFSMDSEGRDIRFSMDKPVEETKTLIAMHNLTEEKLEKAIELGGFPMPSIAVTRADIPHTNFGEITLVMDKGTVDPKADRRNDVFSADAWTPTFPRTEYEANSEVEDRVRRTLQELERKIAPQFQGNLRRVMYGLEDLLNSYDGEENLIAHVLDNDGLKAVYLESLGKHIDEVQVEREVPKRYNQAAQEKYEAIIAALGTRDPAEIGTMPLKDIRDNFGAELEKVVPGISKTSLRLSRFMQQTIDYLMDDGSGPKTEMVVDQNATRQALEDALDRDGYEAWVRELFSGIEGDKGIYNGKERFTPSGRSRSFQQTHLPVTLDNIVKAMAAQNGGNTKNVSGFNGVKTLRAGTAQRFKSIQGMHDLEGRLQNLTEEEQTALTDGLQHRLYDLIDEIDQEAGRKGTSNNLIRFDQIGQIITEASETGRYNVAEIQRVFQENHQTISDELALKVKELLFDVSQMPVNLFEAKPRRAVRFDEVRAAVVPADASEELKRKLEKQGVPVIEYEWDNTEDRLRKVNGIEDVRFSMDGSLSREEYERLAAEVAGDQSKRNEEFVKSRLTPEQYKQYKAFAREDRLFTNSSLRLL